MSFSLSTPKETARGLKRIWESKMGTPSSASIIQDVGLALKALEIVYRTDGAAVEGISDRNGHRQKVVSEGKSVSWGGARNKGKGHKCELTKNTSFHIDLLKFCLKKNTTSVSSSLTQIFLTIRKLDLRGNMVKR